MAQKKQKLSEQLEEAGTICLVTRFNKDFLEEIKLIEELAVVRRVPISQVVRDLLVLGLKSEVDRSPA